MVDAAGPVRGVVTDGDLGRWIHWHPGLRALTPTEGREFSPAGPPKSVGLPPIAASCGKPMDVDEVARLILADRRDSPQRIPPRRTTSLMSVTETTHPRLPDTAADGAHDHEVIYDAESQIRRPGRLVRSMMRDLAASRELAWRLCLRNLSAKYRQSALGYVWAVLPPLVTSLTFVFLRSQGVFSVGATSIPYPAYVMIGTLLWQGFVDALESPLRIVTQSKSMLSKLNFPREALILAGLGEVLFNFAIRIVLLIGVMAWYKIVPPATVILVPVGIAMLIGLGLVIGILLTPLGLLFGDIQQALSTFLPLVYLTLPIAYPPRGSGLSAWLTEINPVAPLILSTRDWLTTGTTDHLLGFILVSLGATLFLLVGWLLYRLSMPILTERFSA